MLKPIEHLVMNPEDIPDMPKATAEYLQVRFNLSYLDNTGHLELMRRAGCSESHILGFIQGLQYASNVIDEIDVRKDMLREE